MKIRNGFVSNSSSSSFCIYGTSVDKYELAEKILEECRKRDTENEIPKEHDEAMEWILEDITYDFEKITGLEGHSMYDEDFIYIGRSWCCIEDNKTGAEFKKDIENKIKELFPEVKFSTIEKAWRDG